MGTRLIINADDLGLHRAIDEGILAAHADGVVTSASLLSVGPTAAEAVRRANVQGLPLGVHLSVSTHLTPAAPMREVRWLAPGGRFRRTWREFTAAYLARLIPLEEIITELRAQVRRAAELGARVDHLDTHQHVHLLPGMTSIVEVLAAELKVPVRWPAEPLKLSGLRRPSAFARAAAVRTLASLKLPRGVVRVPSIGVYESGTLDERRLLKVVGNLPEGDVELITHPGFDPVVVPQDPQWRYGWQTELNAVLSPRVKSALASRNVELISFGQLHQGERLPPGEPVAG